jgi:hypothetical protein
MKTLEININYRNTCMILWVILFLLILSLTVSAQYFETTMEMGAGKYQLTDLRTFQKESLPVIDLPIESVTTFPPYYSYHASILYYPGTQLGIGACGSFYSTGGRNHYADYSGYYKLDLLINCVNMGISSNYQIKLFPTIKIIPEISTGIKLSNLQLIEKLHATEDLSSTEYKIKSLGWWIEPRVAIRYQPFKIIGISASVGYEYNDPSKNHLSHDKERYLQLKNNENVRIGWSGIRAYLGLSFHF